jgi:hypothetical protein
MTTLAPCGREEKITAAGVEIDIECYWRSSDGDGTHPCQVEYVLEWIGHGCALEILDTARLGMGFAGVVLVVTEPLKHLTI